MSGARGRFAATGPLLAIAALAWPWAARPDPPPRPTNAALRKADLKAALVVVDVQDAGPAAPELHPPAVRLDEVFLEGTELLAIERDDRGELRPRLVEVSRGRQATSPFVEVKGLLAQAAAPP